MASKLVQLQSKAFQASQFVARHGSAYYKHLLEQRKPYIQDPPTLEKCNVLSKELFYTRLARFSLLLTVSRNSFYICFFLFFFDEFMVIVYYNVLDNLDY